MAIQIFLILFPMNSEMLFDFSTEANIEGWRVVNDGVMGGRSKGQFSINEEGHGFFRGNVSLENYGGFSSVRYQFETLNTSKFRQLKIRLKGDGKSYQFRVKALDGQRYSYISNAETSGDWETVTISFSAMYPAFRGRRLDLPNYSGEKMMEIAILIGNKKEEAFALQIDSIELE